MISKCSRCNWYNWWNLGQVLDMLALCHHILPQGMPSTRLAAASQSPQLCAQHSTRRCTAVRWKVVTTEQPDSRWPHWHISKKRFTGSPPKVVALIMKRHQKDQKASAASRHGVTASRRHETGHRGLHCCRALGVRILGELRRREKTGDLRIRIHAAQIIAISTAYLSRCCLHAEFSDISESISTLGNSGNSRHEMTRARSAGVSQEVIPVIPWSYFLCFDIFDIDIDGQGKPFFIPLPRIRRYPKIPFQMPLWQTSRGELSSTALCSLSDLQGASAWLCLVRLMCYCTL